MEKTLDSFLSSSKKKTTSTNGNNGNNGNETKSGKRKLSKNNDVDEEEEVKTLTKGPGKKQPPTSNNIEINSKTEIKNIPSNNFSMTSLESFDGFTNGLGTWKEHLSDYVNSNKMKNIFNFLKNEYSSKTIYPPKELIFNAFDKTTWDNLKVVVIGQDPYPNEGQGMGLSFSVNRGVAVPKSLVNIYKCLENDKNVTFKTPKHGDLSKWAEQGVFLLNATLTVVAKAANSHQKISGWADFTDNVIKKISDKKNEIVFLLWGNFAINKKKLIDDKRHHVIQEIHPSPLAASKGDFTKSLQFSKINEYLEKIGKDPIDWSLPA